MESGWRIVLCIAILLVMSPCCAFAEDAATPAATSAPLPAVTNAPLPSIKVSDKADLYDIDASAGDIRYVLEMLARRSGANIVVSPEITGEVNAHLKQMSVDDILEYLSAAQGFSCRKTGGTYLVVGKEKSDKPSPDATVVQPLAPVTETLVWECRHAKPADLTELVAKLFPSIKCAEGPGSVSPELDSGTGGLTSGGMTGASGSAGAAARTNSNKIVLIGDPADMARARDVLTKLDVRRRQVAIDVAITEISTTGSKDLGIEWSWADIGLTETNDSGIGFGKFTKPGMSVTATLSALIKDGKANLLAQPNISVLDGECADILIGDRILFPKLVGYNQIGAPIYDKAEEKVGIYLQIAPRVAGENDIVMTLYPQVSLVTAFLKTQAGDYPQISTREAKTTVSVKSGTTLAIGGLLRSNEINNASKFPLLGDLPLIGHFFRHNKKTTERTEIVILLSPKIVEEGAPIPNPQPLTPKPGGP